MTIYTIYGNHGRYDVNALVKAPDRKRAKALFSKHTGLVAKSCKLLSKDMYDDLSLEEFVDQLKNKRSGVVVYDEGT